MEEIHNNIFNHLRANYPDLTFVLRTTNKYGRLKRGYWFTGGEDYLSLSFWNVKDNLHTTPKICLQVFLKGDTRLVLVDRDAQKTGDMSRTNFFKQIAPALKLQGKIDKKTREESALWERAYSASMDYLEAIDNFIRVEKVTIDTFIELDELKNNKKILFPIVRKEDFEENIARIDEIKRELFKEQIFKEKIDDDALNHIILNRLILKNIGHFESLEVDLFNNSKRVIVLIGENGTGKSTLLQATAFGLTGLKDEKYIIETNDELLNLLRINKAEKGTITYSEGGSIELVYNQKFKNILDFTRVREKINDNGLLEETHTEITDERSDYKNLKETDSKSGFISLVKSFSQLKSVDSQNGNGKSEELERNVPVFLDVTPLIYQVPDKSFDNFRTWVLRAIDIESGNKYSQIKPAIEVTFKVIKEITGGLFEFATLEANQKEIFVKTKDAPDGIPIKLISQGYTNVIGWVGDFTKRLYQTTPENKKATFWESPAICLIDEIDTYLHPKWQRTILRVMAETFTNTHFIVTTHSPLVITNLPHDLATIYQVVKNEEGKIIVAELDINPYGLSASDFLVEAMDSDDMSDDIRQGINAFKQAIDEGNIEEAEKIETQLEAKTDRDKNSELKRLRLEKEVEKQWQNR